MIFRKSKCGLRNKEIEYLEIDNFVVKFLLPIILLQSSEI